ncbi:MAG: hypothetical protein DMG79_07120 [Acidobacteria bacterium]|nr:MAG: hypothetical protein DMG79_07120 [Acidobacteriota bacterium]
MGISRGAIRVMRARSLRPLVKTRAFGQTHTRKKFKPEKLQHETVISPANKKPAPTWGRADFNQRND